jgi:NAD+ kinase
MMKKIGIICKTGITEPTEILKPLLPWLRERGYETFVDLEAAAILGIDGVVRSQIPLLSDVIIVLGGDGTMLSVCRLVGDRQIPIIGINMGSLGFITEVSVGKIYEALERMLAGECPMEERLMLTAHIYRQDESIGEYTVLNDVVVNKGVLARIIDLDIFIDGIFVTAIRADGLIISTPTGSTAYSLSAGGPVLYPTLNCVVITPICPHTLTQRPIVLPDTSAIKIILKSPREDVYLTLDGQVGFYLRPNDVIEVKKSPNKARLLVLCERDYFKVLRKKLKWGDR